MCEVQTPYKIPSLFLYVAVKGRAEQQVIFLGFQSISGQPVMHAYFWPLFFKLFLLKLLVSVPASPVLAADHPSVMQYVCVSGLVDNMSQ